MLTFAEWHYAQSTAEADGNAGIWSHLKVLSQDYSRDKAPKTLYSNLSIQRHT